MTAKNRRKIGESAADPAKTFVRGNARLERMLAAPGMAEAVAGAQQRMHQADRAHAMGLAALRNAFELTQTELARQLGVSQTSVAKIEHRSDMLLSTLTGYVAALGGRIRLVVEFDDGEIEIELPPARPA